MVKGRENIPDPEPCVRTGLWIYLSTMVVAQRQPVEGKGKATSAISSAQLHAEKLFEAKPIAEIREVRRYNSVADRISPTP